MPRGLECPGSATVIASEAGATALSLYGMRSEFPHTRRCNVLEDTANASHAHAHDPSSKEIYARTRCDGRTTAGTAKICSEPDEISTHTHGRGLLLIRRRGYSFGDFTLDLERGALLRGSDEVALRPKSFAVLVHLVERAGILVPKRDLMDEVWQNTVVTDDSLTQCLSDIRKALGDDERKLVRTVPRRGIIFDTPVSALAGPVSTSTGRVARQPPVRYTRIVAAALVLVASVAWIGATLVSRPGELAADPVSLSMLPRDSIDQTYESAPGSIAVLPFDSFSDQAADTLLGRGIADEILHSLAAYDDLRVIARTSSFAFEGSDYGVPRIARLLNVANVLQGSVRREGNRLRITAQMVDANGRQQWSEAYEGEDRALLDLQTEIAAAVVSQLAPHVTVTPLHEVTPDFEAYRLYVLGKQHVYERSVIEARRLLGRAVALDGDSAELQAEYAIALILIESDEKQLSQAREHIARALELKAGQPRALAAQGLLNLYTNPQRAERYLLQALDAEPGMVEAINWLSVALDNQGRGQQSHDLLARAVRIDPVHPTITANLATSFIRRGEPDRAEAILRPTLEMRKVHPYPMDSLLRLLRETGRLTELPLQAHRLAGDGIGPWAAYAELPLLRSHALLGAWDFVEQRSARAMPEPDDPLARTFWARRQFLPARWRGAYESARARAESLLDDNDYPVLLADVGLLRVLDGDHLRGRALLEANPEGYDSGETKRDHRVALAWSYQQTGEFAQARDRLEELESEMREADSIGLLHASGDIYWAALIALLRGDENLALERLGKAVRAGWRDVHIREHDPRWQRLRDDGRFAALMEETRRDVGAQWLALQQDPRYIELLGADSPDAVETDGSSLTTTGGSRAGRLQR